jgi:ankyrin repeat domain-containing protein 50
VISADKEEIESTLVKGANGMYETLMFAALSTIYSRNTYRFCWVYCQLESLKKCLKATAVRRVLTSLPKTLDDTYDRMLLSIDPEYVREAIAALRWLCFSQRPLLVEELAEAIAINPTANTPFDREECLADLYHILQILSSLVVLSTRDKDPYRDTWTELKTINEVKLAHFSVRE